MKTKFPASDLNTHGGGLQICDDGSDGTVQKLGFFGVAPTIQRANANQAKLEDSVQLAQMIALVNELSGDLVVILLEEPFC